MIQYGQYNVPHFDEMVNFGVGQPSTELLPLDIIKEGMNDVLQIEDPSLLQYGDIPGYLEFRKSLARFLSEEYCKIVNPNELFTTNGVTQALSLLCSIFTKTGDKYERQKYRTTAGKYVKNHDLVKKVQKLKHFYRFELIHVRSHTGAQDRHSQGNSIADELAVNGAKKDISK